MWNFELRPASWFGMTVCDSESAPEFTRRVTLAVLFSSPLIDGRRNYSTVALETDLPRIEASDSQLNSPFCDRTTGANLVNPPDRAQFYPFLR